MTDSSFLRDLHARFATPRERVVELVARITGGAVGVIDRVVNGYDNEVYRVETDAAGTVYVRIRRRGEEPDFDGEIAAMERAQAAGVPVPQLVGRDRIAGDDREREVMVVTTAPGVALEALAPPSEPRRAEILTDLGRVLARLHRVEMPGAWRPGPDGRWLSVDELRHYFVRDRLGERPRLFEAGLSEREVDQTYRVLEEVPVWGSPRPVLCHGDLNPGHVFADDGRRVSCLIDWGMWHAGSPLGELAHVWTTFGDDGLGHVLDGYGRGSTGGSTFRRALAVTVCQQQIGYVAHHVTIGDAPGVVRNAAALRAALARLQRA